ncbi:hypothetical protein WG66_002254 [Moniliophthora roreri]|nr:hypothetical protein WG66_002254 [Moniliophthora roreri]
MPSLPNMKQTRRKCLLISGDDFTRLDQRTSRDVVVIPASSKMKGRVASRHVLEMRECHLSVVGKLVGWWYE